MKVIISAGVGKLFFHETVREAAQAGVAVEFITGWIPTPENRTLVNRLGSALGYASLYERLRARSVDNPKVTLRQVPWVEFVNYGIGLLTKFLPLQYTTTASWAFQFAGWASRKHLQGADVFHVRSGAGQGGAIKRARRSRMKILVDHSIAHPEFMKEILDPEYSRAGMPPPQFGESGLWRIVLRDCAAADRILVNSDFVKRTFVNRGYQADKIDVVYLGVKPVFFDLKQSYASSGPIKLLFTGNFELRKGVRVLLEAIRMVRAGGMNVSLHLVGNLENGRACLQESDSAFFTHTKFLPPEALLPALSDADIFIFPTLAEGCSRSAMEAAAAGLPVITTENCGLPFVDNESVIYVGVNDMESLSNAIIRLGSSEALRETIGRNAAASVRRSYTWHHYGQGLRRTYERLHEA